MRRISIAVLAVSALALLAWTAPAVAARGEPIIQFTSTCEMVATGWECVDTGGIAGTAVIVDTSLTPTGPYTLHYVEHGVVTAADGTLTLDVNGIANGLTGGWRAVGVVSDATGAYADLVGHHVQQMGTTTGALPTLSSVGTVTILPG